MASTSLESVDLSTVTGAGPATREKLLRAGVYTVVDLAAKSPSELVEYAGIESYKAQSIVEQAISFLQESGFLRKNLVKASELYELRKTLLRCRTGSEQLDCLLYGGIETQAMTEFYGEFGSGKTQIGHTLCALCQLDIQSGGLGGNALYVDTENTFRASRLHQIAETRGMEPLTVLQKVFVMKVFNASHLELLVRGLGPVIRDNSIRLVIVDSLISLHRAEFAGRGTLSERQQKLNGILHSLLRTAEVYNCAVVITNQVQVSPDGLFRDPIRPAGGNIVAHTSTYRLYLKKAGKVRVAKMVDSPYHAEGEAMFGVSEQGIVDVTREEAVARYA